MPGSSTDGFVAGLVLGAGGSSRLGRPKQLLVHQGRTLLRRAAELVTSCPAGEGHLADAGHRAAGRTDEERLGVGRGGAAAGSAYLL